MGHLTEHRIRLYRFATGSTLEVVLRTQPNAVVTAEGVFEWVAEHYPGWGVETEGGNPKIT